MSRDDIRFFLIAFFVLSGIAFFPSHRVGKFLKTEIGFSLPKVGFHGQAIKWPRRDDVDVLFFDGVAPSYIEAEDSWLGVIGLYERKSVWITGIPSTTQPTPWQNLRAFFYSPTERFFVHRMELKRPFKVSGNRLRLPSSVWKRVNSDELKKKLYRKRTRQLWRNESSDLRRSCWHVPLRSRVNSPFGKPRFLPNGRRYYHSGVDFRARTGTQLKAVSDGLVVFAEHAVVPGKTVIIYHGDGVHTQYMHMSQITVEPGQAVLAGEKIGLSGSTGRVEGPHLHWEVRWKGRHADPFSFLKAIGKPCSQRST